MCSTEGMGGCGGEDNFSQLKMILVTLNNKVRTMGLYHNCNLLPEFEKELRSAKTEALCLLQFARQNNKKNICETNNNFQ